MPEVTYSVLTGDINTAGSLKQLMNQSAFPVTYVLTQAEEAINRRLRVREMLRTETGTLGTTVRTLALPADYLGARWFGITGTNLGIFNRRTLEWIEDRVTYNSTGAISTGKPFDFFADGSTIYFAVIPDNLYPYKMWYYAQPAPLGTATETNFLTNRYPTLLIAQCMVKANEWMKNAQERDYWHAIAEREMTVANAESAQEAWDLDAAVAAM